MIFTFTKNPDLKKKSWVGEWGGGGAGVCDFFCTMNPNLK